MNLFETIRQLDQSLFFFLNGMHNPFWDVVMSLFTRTETWSLFYLTIIYFIVKKYRTKAVSILLLLILAIVIGDQFSVLVKMTVQRFRPSNDPSIQHLVHTVISKGGLYGFFSSHATNTFAVAMFTSRLFRNYRFTILIFIWAILASYTRIYLGLHYPGDILMGIITGCFVGYILSLANGYIETRFFLDRSPKLRENPFSTSESNILILVFLFLLLMTLLIVSRLQHIHLL